MPASARGSWHRLVPIVLLLAACAAPAAPTPPPASGPSPSGAPTSSEPVASEPVASEPVASEPASPSVSAGPSPSTHPSVAPSTFAVSPELLASGIASPVAGTHAGNGDGLIYVVEQAGRIVTVGPDGSLGERPFLDIRERIVSGGERGLLGLAFHPAYETNGRFFVMYTAQPAGANTVSEFTAADGRGDPGSERVLLAIEDFAGNHNGGMVAFGPDGYLYAGTGDGGGGGDPEVNGQDPTSLLGKLLRLDVDAEPTDGRPYAIPPDNPAMTGSDWAPELWAMGLRNPWRFSFDRETGDLWIGDVGQNRFEEIDAAPAGTPGLNYGWNVVEGPECFEDPTCDLGAFTPPVFSYRHDGGCTVIGGYVYRGQALPSAHGAYLFGDYCNGRISTFGAAAALAGSEVQARGLVASEMTLSAFVEDEAGELFVLDLRGDLVRLVLRET